jgi:hypothetical protein
MSIGAAEEKILSDEVVEASIASFQHPTITTRKPSKLVKPCKPLSSLICPANRLPSLLGNCEKRPESSFSQMLKACQT